MLKARVTIGIESLIALIDLIYKPSGNGLAGMRYLSVNNNLGRYYHSMMVLQAICIVI